MTRRPRVAALLRLLRLITRERTSPMSNYQDQTPCRRCATCDRDWPNLAIYNLCPRCQKCTFAHAVTFAPDYPKAKEDAARYKAIRDFDAKVDAGEVLQVPADWVASMEALLALTPSIPDPEPEANA